MEIILKQYPKHSFLSIYFSMLIAISKLYFLLKDFSLSLEGPLAFP